MNEVIDFFSKHTTEEVAEFLLGMYLEHEINGQTLGGYIVDCEAYLGPEDEAAHSFGMRNTPRVQAMYQKPGTIYLYTMHTHLILNIITQPEGIPQGVMIRGLEPAEGIDEMIQNRNGQTGSALSDGPGKLVQALRISKALYGDSIFTSVLHLVPERRRLPKTVEKLPRIGIPNKGIWTDIPLRFTVKGNPYLSKQRRSAIDPDHGWRK
ncbi:putative 3-methyladenine DNA glycosylase [Enterococcus florum]|uniref:Putative 3-methyladenine DNA glycosylase n=1 Tax=Enterococcus florum TaxID=2480627 RepID=A0A4P5P690_9ENTE|nr:DNA-3-methyladenine glycosylase [Enterococcus florum]GCF93250.1 putative 3-methyladenine DNA glycosylase [Enterococcus florum]